jgi:hypothetical protein
MATSGSNTFTLPLDELLKEASKRAGGDPILGQEAGSTSRALNLLFIDMQNRGILLHTMEQVQVTLTSAVATISCDDNCLDVLDMVIEVSGIDIYAERISWGEWLEIPKKDTAALRPTRYFVDRRRDRPVITFWPVPNTDTAIAKYWQVRFVEDATMLAEDPDMPRRFWPALVWGLAYYLACGRGLQFPMDRLQYLKMEFESSLDLAMGEDRERTTFRAVPRLRRR